MTSPLLVMPDANAGLEAEVALFSGEQTGVILWSTDCQSLVCPKSYARRPAFDRAAARSTERGWPVITRSTGGGVVPQENGVLNLALATTVPAGFTIEDGYRLITDPIRACLAERGVQLEPGATTGSFCDGAWNLSSRGRKVVGTAQRWRPMPNATVRLLAHAMILNHGQVLAAVAAVDRFHHDLGLDPIRAGAHTTLEAECADVGAEPNGIASRLYELVAQELARAQTTQMTRLAA